jgi:hypothetical protein
VISIVFVTGPRLPVAVYLLLHGSCRQQHSHPKRSGVGPNRQTSITPTRTQRRRDDTSPAFPGCGWPSRISLIDSTGPTRHLHFHLTFPPPLQRRLASFGSLPGPFAAVCFPNTVCHTLPALCAFGRSRRTKQASLKLTYNLSAQADHRTAGNRRSIGRAAR